MTPEIAAIVLLAAVIAFQQWSMREERDRHAAAFSDLMEQFCRLSLSKNVSEFVMSTDDSPLRTWGLNEPHPDDEDPEPIELPGSMMGD